MVGEENMIQNIVFDMGWVLFSYQPKDFVDKYCPNPDDAELVNRELFDAPEWAETDRGTITDEDYLALVLSRVPERLHEVTRWLFLNWHEMPQPFPEMGKVVAALKQNGYGLYVLSNMSSRFYRFYQRIPAVKYFDGMIISSDVRQMKPEPEIYRTLFDRFRLKPEECFFIDDRLENIEGGEALGMKGFCYRQNVEELKDALRAENIKI